MTQPTREQQAAALEKDWAENPRWKGIKRGYSAADAVRLVIERDDRHGRFRRDARDAAHDERVEHRVADDEDLDAREGEDELSRAIRRERWKLHDRRVPPRTAA